jgi:hypothetical protein
VKLDFFFDGNRATGGVLSGNFAQIGILLIRTGVRYGSKADMAVTLRDVRSTPESRHRMAALARPLSFV